MEEVPCSIKPLKLLQLSGDTTSGCGIIDITFPTAAGVQIAEISFRNNYTALVTVKGKLPATIGDGKFKTIIKDYHLMNTPHFANESQKLITLKLNKVGCEPIVSLRFIIRQPSPQWQNFSLQEMKFFRENSKIVTTSCSEEVSVESMVQMKQIPALEQLASHMKILDDLSTTIQSIHLETSPANFDTDGSYDLNLLSYS